MLIQLMPDKVSEYWDNIAPIIEQALPAMTAKTVDGMANVLRAILLERAHLWVYEEGDKSYFITLTTFLVDPITGQISLTIYALTSLRSITPEIWTRAYETLKGFARSKQCDRIIAFTNNKQIVDYINKHGGNATETLIELEV